MEFLVHFIVGPQSPRVFKKRRKCGLVEDFVGRSTDNERFINSRPLRSLPDEPERPDGRLATLDPRAAERDFLVAFKSPTLFLMEIQRQVSTVVPRLGL